MWMFVTFLVFPPQPQNPREAGWSMSMQISFFCMFVYAQSWL